MRKLLLVSGDLLRSGESAPSYTAGCLISHLRSDPRYGSNFEITHRTINLLDYPPAVYPFSMIDALADVDWGRFDAMAVSVFIWSESLINPLLAWVRRQGFRGQIILGGPQISYLADKGREAETLRTLRGLYPDATHFVIGHGEGALLDFCLSSECAPLLQRSVDFETLASPYLSGVLPVGTMVRMETQRGCPYRCSFCAHRDLVKGGVDRVSLGRVEQELALFCDRGVERINVLDPVFNGGMRARRILGHAKRLGLHASISLQCRFEQLTNDFLDACDGLNVTLEFGLQTINPLEAQAIERPNDVSKVDHWIGELNRRGVPFEVSMIYGLPLQTLNSFRHGIDWLEQRDVPVIKAWPLMILRGTPLVNQAPLYGLKPEVVKQHEVPLVTSSHTFTRSDWDQMAGIAMALAPLARI